MIKYVNISDQNMKNLLYLRDDQIKDCIQLLLYAYRETFSDPSEILKKNSLGAAHHRTLHLIERNQGISVNLSAVGGALRLRTNPCNLN